MFSKWLCLAAVVVLVLSTSLGHAQTEGTMGDITIRTSNTSNITSVEPKFFPQYGSKRVQIRYGPYTAPPASVDNGMHTFVERIAAKPCQNCMITWMQAGLEYPDGTSANADTGVWLHHIVLTNSARPSAVCGLEYGGDRFFASGNERTVVNICVNGTDQAGYFIGPSDNVFMFVELMNENSDPRPLVATITFEYIETVPAQFAKVTPVWLDIGNCTNSDMPAQNNTSFAYSMQPPWKATVNGRVAGMSAHLHDGGTHLEIFKNNDTFCDCTAAYGESPGYVGKMNSTMDMGGMNMSMEMEMKHISSLTTCAHAGDVNIGDEWSITAHYDTKKYSAMMNTDGSIAPIMGISLFYVVDKGNATTADNSTTAGTTSSPSSGPSSTAIATAGAASSMVSFGGLVVGVGAALLL